MKRRIFKFVNKVIKVVAGWKHGALALARAKWPLAGASFKRLESGL